VFSTKQPLIGNGDISLGVKRPGHEADHSLPPMVGDIVLALTDLRGFPLLLIRVGGVMTLTQLYNNVLWVA
jgi:hypothetical protein